MLGLYDTDKITLPSITQYSDMFKKHITVHLGALIYHFTQKALCCFCVIIKRPLSLSVAELVTKLYEAAVRKVPTSEEYHSHLFMAYARVGEYKKMQQVRLCRASICLYIRISVLG